MPNRSDFEPKVREALSLWAQAEFGYPPPTEIVDLLRDEVRRAIAARIGTGNESRPVSPEILEAHLLTSTGEAAEAAPRPLLRLIRGVIGEAIERDEPAEITRMLWAWKTGGGPSIEANLIPLLYSHLQRMAARKLATRQGLRNELDPLELVHELFMRLHLARIPQLWANRHQFFAMTGTALDNLIRDRDKAARRQKRPDNRFKTSIKTAHHPAAPATTVDYVACKQALERLAEINARQQEVIWRRWIIEESVADVARALGVSEMTVKRDYALGMATLRKLMAVES